MDELHQFFAGYFHEDWPVEASGPDEILAAYLAEGHAPTDLARLAALIDAFIDGAESDEALEESLFSELGCYYAPTADGLSARAWLGHVACRLRAAAS